MLLDKKLLDEMLLDEMLLTPPKTLRIAKTAAVAVATAAAVAMKKEQRPPCPKGQS